MAYFRAALFDLDGTLLDTLDDLHNALQGALAQAGYPTRTREETRAFIGNGVRLLIERAVPAGTGDDAIIRVLTDFRARYQAHLCDCTRPYPGILDLLQQLRGSGVPCAVVSNKFNAAAIAVCRHGLGDFPEVIIGEGEGIAKKPDPSGCREAMRRLGVVGTETLYIGDSPVDVETARNAGLRCACVTWGFRSRKDLEGAGADWIVDKPSALAAFFLKGAEQ